MSRNERVNELILFIFADEEPPSYGNTCPQDIKKYTHSNDDVYVTWVTPKFTDNSGEPTTIKTTGQTGSSKYPVGTTTTITYSATDTAGFTTTCSFSIQIISKYSLPEPLMLSVLTCFCSTFVKCNCSKFYN